LFAQVRFHSDKFNNAMAKPGLQASYYHLVLQRGFGGTGQTGIASSRKTTADLLSQAEKRKENHVRI